jgi:hypothetical protein
MDVSYIRLDLNPIGMRDIDDNFSIVFRARIVKVGDSWVPWQPHLLVSHVQP